MWIKAFEGGPYEAYKLQFTKGEAKKAADTVLFLHGSKGLSAEEISDFVGYPLDEVRAILDKAGA